MRIRPSPHSGALWSLQRLRPIGNARYLGDTVGCEIVGEYPFKGVTGGLLDTPLAAGFGGIVGPFDAKVLGKSETGDNPSVD